MTSASDYYICITFAAYGFPISSEMLRFLKFSPLQINLKSVHFEKFLTSKHIERVLV